MEELPKSSWHKATLVQAFAVGSGVRGLRFDVENWPGHIPGQHCSIKLVSPDGYIAERDYSIANEPDQKIVEFGIELIVDGEVSPYLHSMEINEQIEIKGPLGGHFIIDTKSQDPLFLIGGGSGIVPLMSIMRSIDKTKGQRDVTFLGSFKDINHLLYKDDLDLFSQKYTNFHKFITLTQNSPDDWRGFTGRIDTAMLTEVAKNIKPLTETFICGPTLFVEAVSRLLVDNGHEPNKIKTERFG